MYWGQILAGHHDEILSFCSQKKKNTFFVELFCILFAPPPSQAVRDIATESVKWISARNLLTAYTQYTHLLYNCSALFAMLLFTTTFITSKTEERKGPSPFKTTQTFLNEATKILYCKKCGHCSLSKTTNITIM